MAVASSRPGSLTLFAVFNFIFAGFGLLGALGQLAILLVSLSGKLDGEAARHLASPGWAWTLLLASVVHCALLIVSGIGLLRLSVILGRWLATAAAALGLALIVGQFAAMPMVEENQLPMHLVSSAISALYPLMLLTWVNLIVRDVWSPPRLDAGGAGAEGATRSPFALTVIQSLRQSLRGASGPGFVFGTILTGLLLCATMLVAAQFSRANSQHLGVTTSAQRTAFLERGTAFILAKILREEDGPAEAGTLPENAGQDDKRLSATWAAHLVRERPAMLSFTWLLLAIVLPFCAPFAAAGQVARDVGNRGLRFLLPRVDRRTIFLGRATAAAVLVSVTVVALVMISAVVLGMAEEQPDWGALFRSAASAAVILVIVCLPFVALGMLCSTVVGHPFAALSVAQGVVLIVPILSLVLANVWAPLMHILHLLPLAIQFGMFHPTPTVALACAALCLAYAGLFLWLGLAHFLRRDL